MSEDPATPLLLETLKGKNFPGKLPASCEQPGEDPGAGKGGPGGSCSLSCLKFSLYCYNILLLIFGLAGLCVGLWSLVDRGQFLSLLTSSLL